MLRNIALLVVLFHLLPFHGGAQKQRKPSAAEASMIQSADDRINSLKDQRKAAQESVCSAMHMRCIGPNVMSGRVVDVDVNPNDPTHFYVAYASGGLWVTHNNGASFTPVFDHEWVMTIGDIAVDWKHGERIWIGSGEVNSSRSSYSGMGVFRSRELSSGLDAHAWDYCGLGDSHHIGRIVLHPDDENTAWVASMGHLYSGGGDRGVYITRDGGRSWKCVLTCSPESGAVDLVIDPKNPNVLYAALWQRSRSAWDFIAAGNGSGVYRSDDGGVTWKNISQVSATDGQTKVFGSVFPEDAGRIGLALHHSGNAEILYTIIDNQGRRPAETKEERVQEEWKKDYFQYMKKSDLLALNDSMLENFLRDNNFEEVYTAARVKSLVKNDSILPSALYDYLYDANEDLFSTPVIGAEVYAYNVQSGVWNRCHSGYLDDLVFTYGYYFGMIRVSPSDPQLLYAAGVSLIRSKDGGQHWEGINPSNVHADHHALWLNPSKPGHLINGSDGGVQISYDDGQHFVNCNTPSVGQFYSVQVDMAEPYRVYGGLQDNGVWYGPSNAVMSEEWKVTGHNPYTEICSGDGMQVMIDTRDNKTVYTGYQFGNYMRKDLISGEEKWFDVRHKLGEKPLRWNWESPILLSQHNQDILYICSNKVHRSLDKGEHFETLSGDLTHGERKGNVPFGTITCIDESPLQFGLLAAGTDDGRVWISSENGYQWQEISSGLPKGLWVSSLRFSSHALNRIYLTLNGYRHDNFTPYVFVSDDRGKSWRKITEGLFAEPVNVILEDDTRPELLYIGTDQGLYCSFNRGLNWNVLSDALPRVAVHDLVIQKREADLVVATHGRSIWMADLEEIRGLSAEKDSAFALFPLKTMRYDTNWGGSWSKWFEPSVPELKVPFYLQRNATDISMELYHNDDLLLQKKLDGMRAGLNYWVYDLAVEKEAADRLNAQRTEKEEKGGKQKIKQAKNGKYYLSPGRYTLVLKTTSGKKTTELVIE